MTRFFRIAWGDPISAAVDRVAFIAAYRNRADASTCSDEVGEAPLLLRHRHEWPSSRGRVFPP